MSAPRDRITVDARPGGVFETVMVNDADGSEYPTRAVYDEVRAPELLVWTESHSGMRVRSEFVALGPERTEVRIHQTYVPEAFLAPEAQAGFLSSLDRFEAYLAGLAAMTGVGRAIARTTPGRVAGTDEYGALADLLESAERRRVGAPSLCEGWRTREVVAHVTMPARYYGPAFMAELEAAGGDFTRLSNAVAARDGALPDRRAPGRPPLRGAARVAAAGRRRGGRTDPLRHSRARHRGGRVRWRGACPTTASARCSSWCFRTTAAPPVPAEPVRGRSQRRGAASGRPGLGLRARVHW